jgi:hypothetical protein
LETFTAGAETTAVWSVVQWSNVPPDLRFESEYHQPKYLELERSLTRIGCDRLEYLALNINSGPFGSNLLKSLYVEDGVIVLRPFNIEHATIEDENLVFISQADCEAQGLPLYKAGDVAFARVGDIRCGIIPDFGKPITISPNIIVTQLDKRKVNPYFVAAFMNTTLGFSQLERAIKIVAQPTITVETVKSLRIPRIPQRGQLEVERTLRSSFQMRKETKSLYAEAEALLLAELGLDELDLSHQPTYTQSFSQAWVAGRLDSDYWGIEYTTLVGYLRSRPHSSLADLADFANGATPRGADYLEEGIPFLRIQNVGKNRLELDDVVYIDEETHNDLLSRSQLQPGDVLITITGRIGTSAVVPEDIAVGNINQHIVRMRLRGKQTNPYYLAAFLNSQAGRLQTEREAYGTTREALPYYCLERIIIPRAPEALQKLIETKIREAEESLKDAKRLLEGAKQRVEEMVLGEGQGRRHCGAA